MIDELARCRCGSDAELLMHATVDAYYVECTECRRQSALYERSSAAVVAWNEVSND